MLWVPDVSWHRDLSALEGCLPAASCGNDLGAHVGKVTDKEQNQWPVAAAGPCLHHIVGRGPQGL